MAHDFNALYERLVEVAELVGSQAELAKIVGKDPATVNRWIHGRAEPNIDSLIAIARATGISVDWLLGVSNMKLVKVEEVENYDLVIAIKHVKDMHHHREVFIRAKKIYAVEAGLDDVPP